MLSACAVKGPSALSVCAVNGAMLLTAPLKVEPAQASLAPVPQLQCQTVETRKTDPCPDVELDRTGEDAELLWSDGFVACQEVGREQSEVDKAAQEAGNVMKTRADVRRCSM